MKKKIVSVSRKHINNLVMVMKKLLQSRFGLLQIMFFMMTSIKIHAMIFLIRIIDIINHNDRIILLASKKYFACSAKK